MVALSYLHRFSLEHGYRFDKQSLLWTGVRVRTPAQFERWSWLVAVAHNLLVLAREVAGVSLRPWERRHRDPSMQQVRRTMGKLLPQLGTPARPPHSRGKSPGRAKGVKVGKAHDMRNEIALCSRETEKCASLKGKHQSIPLKEADMLSIADGSLHIQTEASSQAATPSWLGEVVLVASHLRTQEILNKISKRVRFARRRFGQYDVLDFLAVLFGYAISGERTVEAFYEAVHPFAHELRNEVVRGSQSARK
jgi:hypothetical protein